MRTKILVVDDEEMDRELLRKIFANEFDIEVASNGQEAVQKIEQMQNELSVILLDLMMPVVNGYQVLNLLSTMPIIKKIPVILISANTDLRIALSCYSLGASDIISKPFIPQIVKRRVMNIVRLFQNQEKLENQLDSTNKKLIEANHRMAEFYNNFIEAVSDIVEFRDMESGLHVKRVKGLTQIMANAYMRLYPEDKLTPEKVDLIVKMSALHDIGKIGIPDNILLKPGRLTDDEREVMKSHTTRGCDILEKLENVQDSEHYKVAYEVIRYHHERYDGKGYPDGLVGDAIPLSAQLVSVVDVYDALVSERIYKKAFTKEQAYNMIKNGECGEFSPKMLKCFDFARKVIELFSDSH